MKKKIAIIGANDSINILIEKAKENGYETHVFAWECGDPGEKSADFFYPISISEKEKILDVCRGLNIEGIASITSDFAFNTVNYVARQLGLVSNSERCEQVARNKYLMRVAFRDAGLYTPWFTKADGSSDLSVMENNEYPVIVKPVDRWSSKGVSRVDRYEDLADAVKYACKESLTGEAIIEDFMDGPEYSAECICYRGERHILAFTQKVTTGYPHYIEREHIQPSNIPLEIQNKVEKVILNALDSLDIENGAAHAEFRILKNGEIGIIEIGARMGGDCIGTYLTPISTGMDYVKMVLDISCGGSPCFDIVTELSPVHVRYVMDEKDLLIYEGLKVKNPDCIVCSDIYDTNFKKEILDSSTRHGFYVVKGSNI